MKFTAADPEKAKQALDLFLAAQRPLLFLGAGCRDALAQPRRRQGFRKFVEKFALPVMTSPGAKGLFPERHPLSLRTYGLAGAIWAASGYVGTFSWAANVIWEARRGRSWYRQWPFNVAVTLVALILITFVLAALVLTGPVASSVGKQLGIGSAALEVWGIAKWPTIVAVRSSGEYRWPAGST